MVGNKVRNSREIMLDTQRSCTRGEFSTIYNDIFILKVFLEIFIVKLMHLSINFREFTSQFGVIFIRKFIPLQRR